MARKRGRSWAGGGFVPWARRNRCVQSRIQSKNFGNGRPSSPVGGFTESSGNVYERSAQGGAFLCFEGNIARGHACAILQQEWFAARLWNVQRQECDSTGCRHAAANPIHNLELVTNPRPHWSHDYADRVLHEAVARIRVFATCTDNRRREIKRWEPRRVSHQHRLCGLSKFKQPVGRVFSKDCRGVQGPPQQPGASPEDHWCRCPFPRLLPRPATVPPQIPAYLRL